MATAFMRQREAIAAFFRRVFLRVEAFVDHDPVLVEEHRAEDVGIEAEAGTRHTELAVSINKRHLRLLDPQMSTTGLSLKCAFV